jgi:hypothetical protein
MEAQARVKVLADDTVRLAEQMMREDTRLNHRSEFVLYVGMDEHNAIRYVGGERYHQTGREDEHFVGCLLMPVRRQSYYHLTAKP